MLRVPCGCCRPPLNTLPAEAARLQASQQVFSDFGNAAAAAAPQLTEVALADSLYRSVARQLQSGAGPAAFPQVGYPRPLLWHAG